MKNQLTRRHFVILAAAGTGAACLLPGCAGNGSGWRFLTYDEASLADAVADQIIPPDAWPGGKESGATNYIDRQLAGPFRRFQATYRKGLSAIQSTSQSKYKKKFEELSPDDQKHFLEEMEAGNLKEGPWADGFDREFFSLIRDHVMQSYYGSPVHGGNRDKISYRMMQIDYPLIIGQNRYKV